MTRYWLYVRWTRLKRRISALWARIEHHSEHFLARGLVAALLLFLLAASAFGAGQKLDDKCCRISWRSRHTGFTGHGDWISEPLAMSWLRSGCFLPADLRDTDEWIELRHKSLLGRWTRKEYRQPCVTGPQLHSKYCPPGTHPVTDGGKVWLNLDTHKIEHHGKKRNWCRVDGPRREE